MTVATVHTKQIYEGNGLAREFAVTFRAMELEQIHCLVVDEAGIETGTTDFALDLENGVLTYPVSGPPLAAGKRLVIYRETPIVQEIDLLEGGPFHAQTHENEFDYHCMIEQELKERADRALEVAMSSGVSGKEMMDEYIRMYQEVTGLSAQAAKDALAAQLAAAQAAEDADRAAIASDTTVLSSVAVNIHKSWIITEDIAAWQIMDMPVNYYPGRDMLDLRMDGIVCVLRGAGVEAAGQYQFDEVGSDPGVLSNQVRLYFDAPAGTVFHAWVLSSITEQAFEQLTQAILQAEAAEAAAEEAQAAAEAAKTIAETISVSALAGQGVNQRYAWEAEQDYEPGNIIKFPIHYYPQRHMLQLYYNGLVCTPVSALDEAQTGEYQYSEIGEIGELSSEVIVNFPVAAGDLMDVWIISSLTEEKLVSLEAAVEVSQAAAAATVAAADEALEAISDSKDSALEVINDNTIDSVSAVNNSRGAALTAIGEAHDSAVNSIDASRTYSVDYITDISNEALAGIGSAKDGALASISPLVDDAQTAQAAAEAAAESAGQEAAAAAEEAVRALVAETASEAAAETVAQIAAEIVGDIAGTAVDAAAVQAVADALEAAMGGTAQQIIDEVNTQISQNVTAAQEAQAAAESAQSAAETAQAQAEDAASHASQIVGTPAAVTVIGTISAGTDVTVPSYTVGSNRLEIYVDGLRCLAGSDDDKAQYHEIGAEGTISTAVRFHNDYGANTVLLAVSRG